MWFFIIGAFLLPSVAVIFANANAPTDPEPSPDTMFDPTRPEIEPPPVG
jgi:hypothetical protein